MPSLEDTLQDILIDLNELISQQVNPHSLLYLSCLPNTFSGPVNILESSVFKRQKFKQKYILVDQAQKMLYIFKNANLDSIYHEFYSLENCLVPVITDHLQFTLNIQTTELVPTGFNFDKAFDKAYIHRKVVIQCQDKYMVCVWLQVINECVSRRSSRISKGDNIFAQKLVNDVESGLNFVLGF